MSSTAAQRTIRSRKSSSRSAAACSWSAWPGRARRMPRHRLHGGIRAARRMTPGFAGRSAERPASAMRRAIGSAWRMVAALPCRRRPPSAARPSGPRALRAQNLKRWRLECGQTPSGFPAAILADPLELRDGRERLPFDILPRPFLGGALQFRSFPGRSFPDAGVSGASLRDRLPAALAAVPPVSHARFAARGWRHGCGSRPFGRHPSRSPGREARSRTACFALAETSLAVPNHRHWRLRRA